MDLENNSWKNLSQLFCPSNETYMGTSAGDSRQFGFSLDMFHYRILPNGERRLTRSLSNSSLGSGSSGSHSYASYAERDTAAERKPDIMITNSKMAKYMTYVIFEVKSTSSSKDTACGIAQLLSFGLAVRKNCKLDNYINLVLINPEKWGIMVLPPYGVELQRVIFYNEIEIFAKQFFRIYLKKTRSSRCCIIWRQ